MILELEISQRWWKESTWNYLIKMISCWRFFAGWDVLESTVISTELYRTSICLFFSNPMCEFCCFDTSYRQRHLFSRVSSLSSIAMMTEDVQRVLSRSGHDRVSSTGPELVLAIIWLKRLKAVAFICVLNGIYVSITEKRAGEPITKREKHAFNRT